jgi:hypothetical protein
MIPRDHASILGVYWLPLIISGAKYAGVPISNVVSAIPF